MREAIEFTCTITLIWQLVGPIIKQLQLHPTPPLIGIPDESALFRMTNLSPKWFFAILFKTIQTFDDQKSEEEVCVSELRLDKNEKRTQFTPIFES